MKNTIGVLIMILWIGSGVYAQVPNLEWQKSYGGSNSDYANSIQQTTDGGYIFAGYSASNNGNLTLNYGNSDAWIVKLDSAGNIIWQKNYGGSNYDCANRVQQTTDGGYIFAGTSSSSDYDTTPMTGDYGNHGSNDAWIVKLDSAGVIVWQKSFGGSFYDDANSIQQTSDGGYIFAGVSHSNDFDVTGHHGTNSSGDFWIAKLDSGGNITWQNSFGGTDVDRAEFIQQTSDGGYVAVGYSISNDGDVIGNHGAGDMWVIKLNSTGTLVWRTALGGTSLENALCVKEISTGGFIVAGQSESVNGNVTGNHGGADVWIVKLDAAGALVWQKSLGGTENDYASSIDETYDNGLIIGAYSSSNDFDVSGHHGLNPVDYWIVKTNSAGTIEWQNSFGGTSVDHLECIQETSDGGYAAVGYSSSNDYDLTPMTGDPGNHGATDSWILKLECLCTGLKEGSIQSNNSYGQFYIRPNPAVKYINVHMGNTTNRQALTITNSLGETLLIKEIPPANQAVRLDVSAYPNGIYFISIANKTIRLVVLR